MWRTAVLLGLTCASSLALAGTCAPLPPVERVLEIDARERTSMAYDEQLGLRSFVLYAYRNIADDVVRGEGEYLDALLGELTEKPCEDRVQHLQWMRAVLLASPSTPDFARRIALTADVLRR